MNKNIVKLIISIVICELAGIIGAIFTASSVNTWYVSLNKPSFNPPNWIFSPVWIILYLLMGIAFYLVWKQANKKLFFGQLILNALWPVLFFGLKCPFLAFIVIVILWILILLTLIDFYKIEKRAGLLLIPYLLWVSFAAVLNFNLFILN